MKRLPVIRRPWRSPAEAGSYKDAIASAAPAQTIESIAPTASRTLLPGGAGIPATGAGYNPHR
jgi:hypothetical protein